MCVSVMGKAFKEAVREGSSRWSQGGNTLAAWCRGPWGRTEDAPDDSSPKAPGAAPAWVDGGAVNLTEEQSSKSRLWATSEEHCLPGSKGLAWNCLS